MAAGGGERIFQTTSKKGRRQISSEVLIISAGRDIPPECQSVVLSIEAALYTRCEQRKLFYAGLRIVSNSGVEVSEQYAHLELAVPNSYVVYFRGLLTEHI